MADEVARRVELEDRRRRHAALVGGFRVGRRADLGARRHRVVAAVHDPDVILRVDGDAGDRSEQPVIRQRLGPERIDLERRRRLADRRRAGEHERRDSGDRQSSLHVVRFLSNGPQYTLAPRRQ